MKEISPPGHVLFQLANACLLLSYASKDVLMLRIVLMLAGLFFVLFGGLGMDTILLDTILWNGVLCLINAARALEIAWERRPIQFEKEEHETVFTELFGPVGIGRLQFKELIKKSLMRSLRQGSIFIEAGNEATNLTLLYSGQLIIYSAPKDGRPPNAVGRVLPMQFVESPQWANIQVLQKKRKKEAASILSSRSKHSSFLVSQSSTDNIVGTNATDVDIDVVRKDDMKRASSVDVTFKAETDITFFTWPMERLQDYIQKQPNIAAPLNSIVGADVATKLFSQNKGDTAKDSIGKRIFMPLDEPIQNAIIPTLDGNKDMERPQDNDDDDTMESTISSDFAGRKSSLDQQISLIAEKRWLERRGAEDTANDEWLAVLLQSRTTLNKYEISVLLSKGRWRHILQKGTTLLREGEPATFLGLVMTGTMSVHKGEGNDAKHLHDITPTQMIGSLELLEIGREHISGETVVSLQPCTWICWDCDDLRELLAPRPCLRSQLTMLVAVDLTAKFRQVEEIV